MAYIISAKRKLELKGKKEEEVENRQIYAIWEKLRMKTNRSPNYFEQAQFEPITAFRPNTQIWKDKEPSVFITMFCVL